MLVLEESRRVSGTHKVVLTVLTYMGVSRGSIRKYEISSLLKLYCSILLCRSV